jgi:arylsulfatase A
MFWNLVLLSVMSVSRGEIHVDHATVNMTAIPYASYEIDSTKKDLLMDVSFPSASSELLPAVIFVHGGGWSKGTRQDGSRTIEALAHGGYFAATIDYRLTGEAGFPAAVHDCKAAIRFLRSNAEELGIDSDNIAIVGFSAGGHLATLAGLSSGVPELDGAMGTSDISTTVACIGSISGAVMPQRAKGWGKEVYENWALQEPSVKVMTTLPVSHLDANDPPVFLLCGAEDQLCPAEFAEEFAHILTKANIECHIEIVEGCGHVIATPSSYLGILAFLDTHLGGDAERVLRNKLQDTSLLGGGGG